MSRSRILPDGEGLRQALRWLSATGRQDATAIEEAARRFDLSPLDEDFLLRHLRERHPPSADTGAG